MLQVYQKGLLLLCFALHYSNIFDVCITCVIIPIKLQFAILIL